MHRSATLKQQTEPAFHFVYIESHSAAHCFLLTLSLHFSFTTGRIRLATSFTPYTRLLATIIPTILKLGTKLSIHLPFQSTDSLNILPSHLKVNAP